MADKRQGAGHASEEERQHERIDEPVSEASQLNKILAYESLERKAAAIATWPFEIPLVGKLTVISLSVTSVIIANYILAFLRSNGLM